MDSKWTLENLQQAVDLWNRALRSIWNLLLMSPEDFSPTIWAVIQKIHTALQGLGLGLLVLFFVAGLLRTCSSLSELKRPEPAIRALLRFAIAKALVTHGMELILGMFRVLRGVTGTILDAGQFGQIRDVELPAPLVAAVNQSSFLEGIGLWVLTLIGAIVTFVMTFVLIMTVYGRFFKLYSYLALAPIPLASAAGEPTQQYAVSFARSFAAVCLEGSVIAICCMLYSMMADTSLHVQPDATVNAQILLYLYYFIFNMMILVGTVKASDRVVRELMGL